VSEYAPKKRTALVFSGSGTSGAYHAGVLQALDESGVKVDLLVGSGAGCVAAAWGAVAGGARLYRQGGFWDGIAWKELYRLRPALRIALLLLGACFGVFLLPLGIALIAGLLFPVALILSLAAPGGAWPDWWSGPPGLLQALQTTYLAAFAAPVFMLCVLAAVAGVRLLMRRRAAPEALESLLDASAAERRLRRGLWQIARGPALQGSPPSSAELGKRYSALLAENLGQPGFRELVLRAADLELGKPLAFALLGDEHRASFSARRGPRAVDLRERALAPLLFDAVVAGLLPPGVAPVRRVKFPRGGPWGGETHRLCDATLFGGSGIAEALAAGAEQVILVAAMPEQPDRAARRGPHALADAALAGLERQAFERDRAETERLNRIVATLGHRVGQGRGWEDPASGREIREVGLYLIRPERRTLGPLELDGSVDPATEVEQSVEELIERGYRDTYRQFLEPVVGAPSEPRRRDDALVPDADEAGARVEL